MKPEEYNAYDEQFTTAADAAQQYLRETDDIVLCSIENGEQIPEDIKSKRQAARQSLADNLEKKQNLWDLANIGLFDRWQSKIGEYVNVGARLSYNDKLYKVIQAHTVQADWTPDTAVSLFVEVSIEEWPEIPEIITAENAWMKGEKGTWKGQHYESLIDNNTWNPEAYPAGWKKC